MNPVGLIGAWLYALAHLTVNAPLGVPATVALALVALVVAIRLGTVGRLSGPRRAGVPASALREVHRRTGVPRQRDPDARGRMRPRAPTPLPSAA